jgi:hypothetical protein
MAETRRTRSDREADLLERAKRRLPGGVLGTARYAPDAAFVVKHDKGSKKRYCGAITIFSIR